MQIRVEVIFPGKLKDEPIICELCKRFDLTLSILEASFSTDTGWAILIFAGSEEELKKAFGYLKNKGVEIKDTRVTP